MPRWILSFLLVVAAVLAVLLVRGLLIAARRRRSEAAELSRREQAAPRVHELTDHPAIRAAAQWCSEILDPGFGNSPDSITPETREIARFALLRAMAEEVRRRMLDPHGGPFRLHDKIQLHMPGPDVSQALEGVGFSPMACSAGRYVTVADLHAVVFYDDGSHQTLWNRPGWDFDTRMAEPLRQCQQAEE